MKNLKNLILLLLMFGASDILAQNKEIESMNMITFDDDMLTTTSKLYFDGEFTYVAFGFQWEIHLGKPPKKKKDPIPPTVDAENSFGILLQKRDQENNLIWNKVLKLGDRSKADQYSIMFNNISDMTIVNGNIYLTGSFEHEADFGEGIKLIADGLNDMYVAKINSSGQTQWAIRAGGSGKVTQEADAGGRSITAAPDGSVYAIGILNAWPNGGGTIGNTSVPLSKDGAQNTLMKFSPDGKLIWHKLAAAGTGGPNSDMAIDKSGNIYISGATQFALEWEGNQETVNGMRDAYIMKLDANGKWVWGKTWGWGKGPFDGKTIDAENVISMSITEQGNIAAFMTLYEGAKIDSKTITATKGAPTKLSYVGVTLNTNGEITSTQTYDGKWLELFKLSGSFSSTRNVGKIFVSTTKGMKVNGEKLKKGGYYVLNADGSFEFLYDLTYDSKVYLLYPHGVSVLGDELFVVGKLKKASDVVGGTAGKLMQKQIDKNYIYKRDLDVGLLLIKYSI